MGLTGTWRPGPETMRRALRIVTHSRERRRQPPTRRVIRTATRRFRPGPTRRPRPRATVGTRRLGPHANASAPGTFRPGCGPCAPPLPIGLTAADLFAGGEVSRADSRVRSPGSFTCVVALRPHRPLMPYRRRITIQRQSGGGPLQLPRSSGTRWSLPNRSLVSPVNSTGSRTTSLEGVWRTVVRAAELGSLMLLSSRGCTPCYCQPDSGHG